MLNLMTIELIYVIYPLKVMPNIAFVAMQIVLLHELNSNLYEVYDYV